MRRKTASVDAIVDRGNCLGSPGRFPEDARPRLFTVELLRVRRPRRSAEERCGEWEEPPALQWEVPVRVEAAIAQRIGRLPKSLRHLLQIASVEGESFTVEVEAELQGIGVPALLKHMGEELDRQHQLVRA
jgi:hypothetical protein